MNIPKKLTSLFALLFVLVLGSLFFWFKGKPAAPNINPLTKYEVEKISSIFIDNWFSSTTIQQQGGKWVVTRPVTDMADPEVMNNLLFSLKSFSIGSVISQKPGNYEKFQLEKEKAARIQVFVEGLDKPVLDGHVGKTVTSSDDCYFRFEGKEPVYIAYNLYQAFFRRDSRSYRFSRIFSVDVDQSNSIIIEHDKKSWTIRRSSPVWTLEGAQKPIDPKQISVWLDKMKNWLITDFEPAGGRMDAYGFDHPYMKVTLELPTGPHNVIFGDQRHSIAAGQTQVMRFVKVDGRDSVLLCSFQTPDEILLELAQYK